MSEQLHEKSKYRMFGLCISSELPFEAPLADKDDKPEVFITYGTCPSLQNAPVLTEDWFQCNDREVWANIDEDIFYIHDGQEILIQNGGKMTDDVLRMYVLGLCMGAVLWQKGRLPLHGSCLCKDGKAFLITGQSGAGKSTLATELLSRGWKLMSDDITAVHRENGVYYASSSFGGQKLWQDAIDAHDRGQRGKGGLLVEEEGRKKYQISAGDRFLSTTLPLSGGVMLTHGTEELLCSRVEGFPKVDLLTRNLYRKYCVNHPEAKSEWLKKCIELASQMELFLVERPDGRRTEKEIADWLEQEWGQEK